MKKIGMFWQKNFLNKIVIILIGLIFTGMVAEAFSESEVDVSKNKADVSENKVDVSENDSFQSKSTIDTCDGIKITKNCELDGTVYKIYVYHPAQEEKFHYETNTTYDKKIVGYCTLCNDGTRSPSCSTGRGTCSHHGGVAEWNAPIYEEVANQEKIKIVDSSYVEAWYEKVIK